MVAEANLKSKTFKGTIWGTLERFSAQGISFIVQMVMARVLTPEDYGLVGMVLVVVNVAQSLVDSGFTQALIRKQDRTETDNSTAFYFNVVIGFLLYIIVWFLAPLVVMIYDEPRLLWMTRVLALPLLFNSLTVVQRALFTANMDFKTQTFATLPAAIISGVIGVYMAYTGWGVWSIVAVNVFNLVLPCGFFWIYSKWRPTWVFSWESFRQLFFFGYKIAASGLIHTAYTNGFNFIVGKFYSAASLGFFTYAQRYVLFFSSNVSGILLRVTYPVLCKFQDDDIQLRAVFTKMIRVSSFIIFALMMGLAGVAQPLIQVILTEKWSYSADLLQILCLGFIWFPVYSMNLNILLVKGKSNLYLKLEIVKKIIFVAVLVGACFISLEAMCWAIVVNSVVEVFVNSYYTQKLIGISIFRQLREIMPSLIYSVLMAVVAWIVTQVTPGGELVKLIAGIIAGTLFFFTVTYLMKSQDLAYCLSLIKRKTDS